MMAGGISIHGVDVARGIAAAGLMVELHALTPERRLLAAGPLGASGQLDHPTARGEGVALGHHEVLFHIGDWLRAAGYPGEQIGFLDIMPFRFVVTELDRHLHLPLKFTPYGVSLFLGV